MAGTSYSGVGGTKTTPNYGSADFWVVKVSDVELPVGAPVVLVNGVYAQQDHVQVIFTNVATVTMTSSITNALIYYTLDGTRPSLGAGSTHYTGPFVASNSIVVQALAAYPDLSHEPDPVTNFIDFFTAFYTLTDATHGGGTVSFDPPLSSAPFISKSLVTATATAASGWSFDHWEGDAAGTNSQTFVTVNTNKSVKAVFTTRLYRAAQPTNGGAVVASPPGDVYAYGTTVSLAAVPSAGSYFVFWGNSNYPPSSPLTLTITNANPIVTAAFAPLHTISFSLTLLANGPGGFTVSPLLSYYGAGATVTVTPTPSPGKYFSGWSGDASGTANPLTVVMARSKTITATFSSFAITQQPQSNTVGNGGNVAFSVGAAGGGALGYQWLFKGSLVSGATNSTLAFSGVTTNQAGGYSVVVTSGTAVTPAMANGRWQMANSPYVVDTNVRTRCSQAGAAAQAGRTIR